MKRKLISFDAFKQLEQASLSHAETELIVAEDVLSKTFGCDVQLHCFSENDVTYSTDNGTFIHAIYKMENDQVILENIQELVLEEDSTKKAAHEIVNKLVDAILEDNEAQAHSLFGEYFDSPAVKHQLVNEAKFNVTASKPTGRPSKLKGRKQNRSLVMKRIRSRIRTLSKMSPSEKAALKAKRKLERKKLGQTINKRARVYARKANMKEWANLCENVVDYLNYKELGPTFKNSAIRTDERGNITDVAIPNSVKRNEGKILSFNWKTLDHEMKVLRTNSKKMNEDQVFVRALADLKRYNNISDNGALEETLEAIVAKWPDVIYLTQDELSSQIGESLNMANVTNFDDATCNFMAEAILRTAHHAYTDKVKKIAHFAGVSNDITSECKECKDSYLEFKQVVDNFYQQLDESDNADLRVFKDLYKTLHEIHGIAANSGDEQTKNEVYEFMSECEEILNRQSAPNLELVEAIANFIEDLIEANLVGAEDTWDVSNNTHNTVNGDHPMTHWAAKQHGAVPSNYTGDWGSEAPVSDGKSYKNKLDDEMRNRAWGNVGGEDTWPSLSNPYIPKPYGEFTMRGEKGADKDGDNDWSRWQSADTWPNLNNPYIPKEGGGTGGAGYKMNSDDLVVDK